MSCTVVRMCVVVSLPWTFHTTCCQRPELEWGLGEERAQGKVERLRLCCSQRLLCPVRLTGCAPSFALPAASRAVRHPRKTHILPHTSPGPAER